MYDCESILSLYSNLNYYLKFFEGRFLSEECKLKMLD